MTDAARYERRDGGGKNGPDALCAGGTVRVHRLRPVSRDEVILPERTVALLERNVTGFIRARQHIKDLGLSAKKGALVSDVVALKNGWIVTSPAPAVTYSA